ncbi:MAG: sulfatase-like hydrolase/transferase [Verrucomicrobiales bacterium]
MIRFMLLAFFAALAIARAEKPHIILVMADDQGWGDMAYTGHPEVKTPNFDRAAAEGLRFDRFYAAAPVCSPTRASVLTGRNPNRMGVYQWGYPMRPQETTLAEALKDVGYATSHFGKWHLGSVRAQSPANPGANGFDHWLSTPNFYENDATFSDHGKAVQLEGESSVLIVEKALAWMKQHQDSGTPLFSVIWFGSPHLPHIADPQDAAHYAHLDKKQQNFLGEITGMDRAYGKLTAGLAELGLRDNTLIWYTSDNGALPIGNAKPYRGKKGSIYEGGLRVPAFIEWPAKIRKPRSLGFPAFSSDIFPTLLDLVGHQVEKPVPLDGTSLKKHLLSSDAPAASPRGLGFWDTPHPGIKTPSAAWMAELLATQSQGRDLPPHPSSLKAEQVPHPPHAATDFKGHAAWIKGDYKLHRIEKKNKVRWELYHLGKDPAESKNLAQSEPELVRELRTELETWLGSVIDSLNGADYR